MNEHPEHWRYGIWSITVMPVRRAGLTPCCICGEAGTCGMWARGPDVVHITAQFCGKHRPRKSTIPDLPWARLKQGGLELKYAKNGPPASSQADGPGGERTPSA